MRAIAQSRDAAVTQSLRTMLTGFGGLAAETIPGFLMETHKAVGKTVRTTAEFPLTGRVCSGWAGDCTNGGATLQFFFVFFGAGVMSETMATAREYLC